MNVAIYASRMEGLGFARIRQGPCELCSLDAGDPHEGREAEKVRLLAKLEG